MKNLRILLLGMLALLTTSCFQHHTTISLNKDGSGTVTEKMLLGEQMLAMMAQFGGAGLDPLAQMAEDARKQAEGRAAEMGEGVTLKEVKPLHEGGAKGMVAVFAFTDINQLKYSAGGGMEGMQPPTEGEAKPVDKSPLRFSYKDGVLTLVATDPPGVEAGEAPEVDAAGLAMARQMLKEVKMSLRIELPGGIAATNAKHVDGNTVTLVELSMEALLKDEAKFKQLMASKGGSFAQTRKALEGVEGIKFEPNEKLEITLK